MIIDYVLTHGGAPTQRRCAFCRRRQGHNKPHTSGFDSHTANHTKTTTMTHGVRKIQIQDPYSDGTEDIKLYYSTITDNVGITCGEQDVFANRNATLGVMG